MSKRTSLGLLASVAAATVAITPAAGKQPKTPNLVFVLADNVGYGDLGALAAANFVEHLSGSLT